MSQNFSLPSLLYQQAASILQLQPIPCSIKYPPYAPNLQQKITLAQYYTLLNIYFLDKPTTLLAFIESSILDSTLNLQLYLQSLFALSSILTASKLKYEHLKTLYRAIYNVKEVRDQIEKGCAIPHEIAQSIPAFRNKQLMKTNQQVQSQVYQQNIAYTAISLKLANLYSSACPHQHQRIWLQIIEIIGINDLDCRGVLLKILQGMTMARYIQATSFILGRCLEEIGVEIVIRLIGEVLGEGKDGKAVLNGRISGDFSFEPKQYIFKTVAILIDEGKLPMEDIFDQLTPSLCVLTQISQRTLDCHKKYIKKTLKKSFEESQILSPLQCWGQLFFSSKLQLLNQLILLNKLNRVISILQNYHISLELIYTPSIFHSLSLLLEWVIEPLTANIGYRRFFKNHNKIKGLEFPVGFFKQCSQVSNQMIDTLSKILQIGKSYVFANKKTFSKVCRLFKQICSKNEKLPMQKSDVNKKIISFIANVIKRHLLPSIQYYEFDPSACMELDRLIDCYKFKFQFEIFADSIKNRQFSNLQLSSVHYEVSRQQIQYLNRISSNCGVIVKKMRNLMFSHMFSALLPIFNRIIYNTSQSTLDVILEALNMTPKLTKKVALFFVFLNLGNEQCNEKDGKTQERFRCLVDFTNALLLFQKNNEDFIKIIIEYIFYKLSKIVIEPFSSSLPLQQIHFLQSILSPLLPIQLEESIVKKNHRVCLACGPLMKIKLKNGIQNFYKNTHIRKSLIKCLFIVNNKSIFDGYFYFILLKLNEFLTFASKRIKRDIEAFSNLYDKIIALIVSLINISQFQLHNSALIQHYFSIKIFEPTTTNYKLPYQISFYIIKRSIRQRMEENKFDWDDGQVWAELKSHSCQHFAALLMERAKERELFEWGWEEAELEWFISTDIFLLFWVQDSEYSLYSVKFYLQELKMLKKQFDQCVDPIKKQILSRFYDELLSQNQRNYKLSEQLKIQQNGNNKKAKKSYYNKYLLPTDCYSGTEQHCLDFFKMLIQYCIFPRAMLCKTESYYSFSFYYYVLKNNNLFPKRKLIKALCLLAQSIAHYAPYATLRESSELLSPQYSSCIAIISQWHSYDKLNAKLRSYDLIKQKLSPQEYDEALNILYKSQICIGKQLMEDNNHEIFIIKNKLNFIFHSQFIPFCIEQKDIILKWLTQSRQTFKARSDIITMINRLQSEIKDRNKALKAFPKHIKDLRVSEITIQKKVNAVIRDKEIDPFKKIYPDLDTNFSSTKESSILPESTKKCEIIIHSSSEEINPNKVQDGSKAKLKKSKKKSK